MSRVPVVSGRQLGFLGGEEARGQELDPGDIKKKNKIRKENFSLYDYKSHNIHTWEKI